MKSAIGMMVNTNRNTRNVNVARSWPLKTRPMNTASSRLVLR